MTARKSKDVVRYVGTSDVRAIHAEDWKRIGIEQDDVTWDASNDFTVAVADLHADALAFLAANESEWTVLTKAEAEAEDQLELDLEPES
jgi:hypothetical protein